VPLTLRHRHDWQQGIIRLKDGSVALVDPEDWPWIKPLAWHRCTRANSTLVYASHSFDDEHGKRQNILLHRYVLNLVNSDEVIVDHANGFGLDNRRSNLRACSAAENTYNKRKHRSSQWPYKGISGRTGRWTAEIQREGIRHHLGSFDSAEAAASAYDAAARRLFGEFARLNFPTP
jgi:hypothetical protein